jgi:hypothetical protein
MKSFLVGIKNVLLWSYARGTWQYDVLCGLIVLTLIIWPSHTPKRNAQTEQAKIGQAVAAKFQGGLLERKIDEAQLRAFLQVQNKLELLNSPQEAVVLYLQADAKAAITLASLEPFGDARGHTGYRVRYSSN